MKIAWPKLRAAEDQRPEGRKTDTYAQQDRQESVERVPFFRGLATHRGASKKDGDGHRQKRDRIAKERSQECGNARSETRICRRCEHFHDCAEVRMPGTDGSELEKEDRQ